MNPVATMCHPAPITETQFKVPTASVHVSGMSGWLPRPLPEGAFAEGRVTFFLAHIVLGLVFMFGLGPFLAPYLAHDTSDKWVHFWFIVRTWTPMAVVMPLGGVTIANLVAYSTHVKETRAVPSREPDWAAVRASLPLVAFNMVLVTVYTAAMLMLLPASAFSSDLPSTGKVVADVVMFFVCFEVYAYHGHRMLHNVKSLFQAIHSVHHRYESQPFALGLLCAHPLEITLLNFTAAHLGFVIMGTHFLMVILLGFINVGLAAADHSGFLFHDSFGVHDFHHQLHHFNFGVYGVMDALYGTLRTDPMAGTSNAIAEPRYQRISASKTN